ncbi:MAG: 3-keto-disaccharide hydrolase [Thermoguttaceae bacterium]|jgi:hypothetical protein
MKRISIMLFALLALLVYSPTQPALAADQKSDKPEYDAIAESQKDDDKYEWTPLFDGKTLTNWIDLKDGGDEAVEVVDGVLRLGMGPTTTTIRFDVDNSEIELPTENYEIEYVAQRSAGTDFFAAATFPVGESFVTFINGGWGGYVVGLSNIDDMDASENSTSSFFNFKTQVWYRFRVQVSAKTVRVWVNDEAIIDYPIVGHKVNTRFEVEKSQPLGFTSWVSTGLIKTLRMRTLSEEEVKEMDARAEENAKYFNFSL